MLRIETFSVPLHRVFHSIRFKVNKGWVTAVTLFLCLTYLNLTLPSCIKSVKVNKPSGYLHIRLEKKRETTNKQTKKKKR
jgi:hypothetical protein